MVSERYYFLQREYEPELVGVKDASAQGQLRRDKFSKKENFDDYCNFFVNYSALDNQTRFPGFDFELEYVELKKSARVTDFLYFGPSFRHKFLVSEKVRNIFSEFNVAPFKFYNSKIYVKEIFRYAYQFFYSPLFGFEVVDFERSVFSIGMKRCERTPVSITSKAEYMKVFQEVKQPVHNERIVLKSPSMLKFDYFNLEICTDAIVSERLKIMLTKEGITGIRFEEIDESQFCIL